MREGETVNSRIDPTSVGQIKPLQPESHAPELREIVWISIRFPREEKSLHQHTLDHFKNCWTYQLFSLLHPLNNKVEEQQDRKRLTQRRVEGRMKKALWQPRDRGNAELITNPSPGVRQHIMTPTRRESLLIKVKGDQLSRWLPTNIRGNRMFNGLCTYRRLFSTPSPKLINRTEPC